MFDQLKAVMLLSECNGRDIWPVDLCRQKGVPEAWLDELVVCFESGFQSDLETIYVERDIVNQFHGVQDLHLAFKLGEFLGVDTLRLTATVLGREAQVRAIQEAVEEI